MLQGLGVKSWMRELCLKNVLLVGFSLVYGPEPMRAFGGGLSTQASIFSPKSLGNTPHHLRLTSAAYLSEVTPYKRRL